MIGRKHRNLLVKIADVFLGALFPGMLLSGLYIVYLLGISWLKYRQCIGYVLRAEGSTLCCVESNGIHGTNEILMV